MRSASTSTTTRRRGPTARLPVLPAVAAASPGLGLAVGKPVAGRLSR